MTFKEWEYKWQHGKGKDYVTEDEAAVLLDWRAERTLLIAEKEVLASQLLGLQDAKLMK